MVSAGGTRSSAHTTLAKEGPRAPDMVVFCARFASGKETGGERRLTLFTYQTGQRSPAQALHISGKYVTFICFFLSVYSLCCQVEAAQCA